MFVAAVITDNSLGTVRQADTLEGAVAQGVHLASLLANPPTDNPAEPLDKWKEAVRDTLTNDQTYEGERQDGTPFVIAVGQVEEVEVERGCMTDMRCPHCDAPVHGNGNEEVVAGNRGTDITQCHFCKNPVMRNEQPDPDEGLGICYSFSKTAKKPLTLEELAGKLGKNPDTLRKTLPLKKGKK